MTSSPPSPAAAPLPLQPGPSSLSSPPTLTLPLVRTPRLPPSEPWAWLRALEWSGELAALPKPTTSSPASGGRCCSRSCSQRCFTSTRAFEARRRLASLWPVCRGCRMPCPLIRGLGGSVGGVGVSLCCGGDVGAPDLDRAAVVRVQADWASCSRSPHSAVLPATAIACNAVPSELWLLWCCMDGWRRGWPCAVAAAPIGCCALTLTLCVSCSSGAHGAGQAPGESGPDQAHGLRCSKGSSAACGEVG